MLTDPATPALPDDVATLQSLVARLSAPLNARDRIIEVLKEQLDALRRRHFGQRSERLTRLADQLELQIEEMEQQRGRTEATATVPEPAEKSPARAERLRPVRKPLPADLPREEEVLAPLTDVISSHVFEAAKLHADDTPVPVLAPGAGKTRTGRLWVYARDDRASGDATAPAVLYRFARPQG